MIRIHSKQIGTNKDIYNMKIEELNMLSKVATGKLAGGNRGTKTGIRTNEQRWRETAWEEKQRRLERGNDVFGGWTADDRRGVWLPR